MSARSRTVSVLLASSVLVGSSWGQCDRDEWYASDASLVDEFGFSISADANTVLVGAPSATGAVFGNSGAAYVFERQAGGFVEAQKLFASDGGLNEEFGWALALDDGRAAIGAFRIGAPLGTGGVYVFDRTSSGWVETQKLLPSNPAGEMGFAVALDGDRLVSSSRGISSAWIFEFDGTTWTETAELTGNFGKSLALDGDTVLVGDFENSSLGGLNGAVQAYELQAGVWTPTQTLFPSGADSRHALFGSSLALDGDRLLVGAPGSDGVAKNGGAAFVFDRQGGVWTQTAVLHALDTPENAGFGVSVALSGDRLVVGASSADGLTFRTGAAFVFELTGGVWQQTARLDAVDGVTDQSLGFSVGLAGGTVLAGSSRDGDMGFATGSVYAFELSPAAHTFCHCSSAAPCANEGPWGGCVSQSGEGASLLAIGSASVAADDLLFQTTYLARGTPGLLFMSSGTLSAVPFGNGQLCVGGAKLFRFPVRIADASRCVQEGPGIVAHAASHFGASGVITAGSTWAFQHWFRDAGGPCGAAFNTSNAVAVTFQP